MQAASGGPTLKSAESPPKGLVVPSNDRWWETREWMLLWPRRRFTLGIEITEEDLSTSLAGRCPCSTRRSLKNTSRHDTRRRLFDVSHMGRFRFQGPGTAAWLDGLLTRRVTDLEPGQIRYSLVTRDDGGVLDDVLVYYLPLPDHPETYELVVNASNRAKIWDWLLAHAPSRDTVADVRPDAGDRHDCGSGAAGTRLGR